MQNTKRTTFISSDTGRTCEHCDTWIGSFNGSSDVAADINHYIQDHGYRLLHVGTETRTSMDGKFCSHTIAVLGHDEPPPLRPAAKIIVGVDLGGLPGKVAD